MTQQLLQVACTLSNIDQAAKRFWEVARHYRVFAFSGHMGAGKTTFIHALCDTIHVQDSVSSPTFALVNEYHFTGENGRDETIFHMDWYRLKDAAEAINAGMEDCVLTAMRGDARCFIEWPEKAKGLLPKPYVWITIEAQDVDVRIITVELVNNATP